jgi:branched-chain amino acid transport system substrate-binding protein
MAKIQDGFGRVGVLSLTLAVLLSSIATARADEPPIKIGLTTDLTGVAAVYARGQVNGVQLAADEINAAGGIKGRKLEIIVRDSQLKPELGASLTRDLINREHVDYLIGPDSSAVGVAVSNVARQYKKVVMMTIPNTPRLTGELFHPYFFTIVETGTMLARAMADGPGKQYNRIAFIGGDYEASHQAVKYFTDFLAKSNPKAELIQTQWPKLGETDFTPYITQIIAAKPDLVFSYLWGSDLIAFIKQAKPYGLFDKTKVATLLFLDDLRVLGPDMPDGIIGQMYAPPFATNTDRMHDFIKRYEAKYQEYPSDYPVLGYDGMSVLAAGIAAASSFSSDDVVKALEGIKIEGLEGPIQFRAVDHQSTGFSFLGTTGTEPGSTLPFKTMVDIKRIPAQDVWPTPEEILAERRPK